MHYDDEEVKILDALEKNLLELRIPAQWEIEIIKVAAENTLR